MTRPTTAESSVVSYDDSDWSHFEETFESDMADSLPPLGLKRVSSCFLSLPPSESCGSLEEHAESTMQEISAEILYHDILMQVFTYLHESDLASFSITARRPNLECFYYLQLKLQNSLLFSPQDQPDNLLSRLALNDKAEAMQIVQEFIDSSTSASHIMIPSLRQVFTRNGVPPLASAAVLMTLVGASYTDFSTTFGVNTAELPNMLFKVGFVGGLMGAASQMNSKDMQQRVAQRMQQASRELLRKDSAWNKLMQAAYEAAYGETTEQGVEPFVLFSPYDHIPDENSATTEDSVTHPSIPAIVTKPPTGCVGAYHRAISRAKQRLNELVRESRRVKFLALSAPEQRECTIALLDACADDVHLATVKSLAQHVDLQGFYVGSDGTETCALHMAAFHGSVQILEFLCRDVDVDPGQDGGCVNVNLQDSNGWTALHFAAGANSAEAVRVLCRYGAKLNIEAANGYTPLQWAVRLQNQTVAQELKAGQEISMPLSSLASRFFALIPSH